LAGYQKKLFCEKCNFKPMYAGQLDVFFIDENLNNTKWNNLKTVCLNCKTELGIDPKGWKQGDLIPDL
tara:strand:+ start:723 stop:926 length:204 start_codon:yes stop_codon:yes gene_type:complete